MLGKSLLILFVVLGVVLVLFLLLAAWVFLYLKRQAIRHLRPNPHDIHRDLERLRRTHANLSTDELAAKVVNNQALFLGLTGVLSGFGGIVSALIGMPLDLSVSTLRQMKMVHMLTAIYGNDDLDPEMLEIRYMSLVLGGAGAAKLLLRLIIKLIGESIPFVGSVAGFVINSMITKSIGEAAITWNKGETLRQRGSKIYKEKIGEVKEKIGSVQGAKREEPKSPTPRLLEDKPTVPEAVSPKVMPVIPEKNVSD